MLILPAKIGNMMIELIFNQNNIKRLIIFLLTWYTFFIVSDGILSSNDKSHAALASALFFENTVQITDSNLFGVDYPDYAIKDNLIYSDRLPGTALSSLLFFKIDHIRQFILKTSSSANKKQSTEITLMLFASFIGALGVYLIFNFVKKVFKASNLEAVITTLLIAICTTYLQESARFFSHIFSMILITLATYLTFRHSKGNPYIIYIITTIIGASILIELQNILYIAPLSIYFWIKQGYRLKVNIKNILLETTLSSIIIFIFLSILVGYNYITFGEIILKSNTFNPFFPEEKTFSDALSGNFLSGIDNLFFNIIRVDSFWNWKGYLNNGTQGILLLSPILLYAAYGYYSMSTKFKLESITMLSIIALGVIVAALHVTTLIRHIFTIQVLLFLPIVFYIKHLSTQKGISKIISIILLFFLSIYSASRILFLTFYSFSRERNMFSFDLTTKSYHFLTFAFLLILIALFITFIYLTISKSLKHEWITQKS